jgi:hypothetical protein
MDSTTLLIIAGFFFVIGAAVVGIIWSLIGLIRRGTRKSKPPDMTADNLEEIARLMRDTQTQDLVVEMEGKPYNAVQELSSIQLHRLNFTSNVLVDWLGRHADSEPEVKADISTPIEQTPTTEQTPAPEPVGNVEPALPVDVPDTNEWIPAETLPTDPTIPHVPPFEVEPEPEVKPVSTELPDVVGGIINPTPKPAPVYKSIAMQINDILQERIAGTPFESRGITVSDAPDHGVSVSLDGEKYPGVKDIPDESVRDLIRSAVMEWEKQGKANS